MAWVMLNNLSAEVYLLSLVGSLYIALGLKVLHVGKSCWLIVQMPSVVGVLLGSQTFEAESLPSLSRSSRRNEERGSRV